MEGSESSGLWSLFLLEKEFLDFIVAVLEAYGGLETQAGDCLITIKSHPGETIAILKAVLFQILTQFIDSLSL